MDDSNQLDVPPSFTALFTSAAGRLTQPPATVRERYSLCEDMALMLAERAAATYHADDADRAQVLERVRLAITGDDVPLQPVEVDWVVLRTAELLGG